MKIRTRAQFQIALPFAEAKSLRTQLVWGESAQAAPRVYEIKLDGKNYREFSDRIFLNDGSVMEVGNEKIPLTCVFVEGRDMRSLKQSNPQIPDFLLKVTLVARDYTCTGPFNPGFPQSGGKPELWDTFLSYEVRDPTLMLPLDAKLRYSWNEFRALFVDGGGESP